MDLAGPGTARQKDYSLGNGQPRGKNGPQALEGITGSISKESTAFHR